MIDTTWELMDLDSANQVGFYESEEEALNVVRRAFNAHGFAAIAGLALAKRADEDLVVIAQGVELAQRAEGPILVYLAEDSRLSKAAPVTRGTASTSSVVGRNAQRGASTWYVPLGERPHRSMTSAAFKES